MSTKDELIDLLELQPHPEGGYFKETYRSESEIGDLPEYFSGNRNYATCIYFLLTGDAFSAFHRINQDEIWHFYQGSVIELHTIAEDGIHEKHMIGNDFSSGQTPQLVVKGGSWFAAKVLNNDGFGLVGCTVAPGFDFKDFELAQRAKLIELYPQHEQLITDFTRIDEQ